MVGGESDILLESLGKSKVNPITGGSTNVTPNPYKDILMGGKTPEINATAKGFTPLSNQNSSRTPLSGYNGFMNKTPLSSSKGSVSVQNGNIKRQNGMFLEYNDELK